jgi:hypothetical protein
VLGTCNRPDRRRRIGEVDVGRPSALPENVFSNRPARDVLIDSPDPKEDGRRSERKVLLPPPRPQGRDEQMKEIAGPVRHTAEPSQNGRPKPDTRLG